MKRTNENAVTIFQNEEFGEIRTVIIDGEPWFVGKDVAEALGYVKARNAISSHVSEEDKKDAPIQGDVGGVQQMTIINESGLYSLIFSSKLESAKRFKHWVTSEVLPTIRKTGSYSQTQELSTMDKIKLIATGVDEINERVDKVENRIRAIEESLDVLGSDANAGKLRLLKSRVKARAYELVSGNSNSEVLWLSYFISGNYANIKSYYDIARIGQLPMKNYENAMEMAKSWKPNWVYLQNRIAKMQGEREKNLLSDKKVIALLQYLSETNNGEINPF